MKQKKYLKFPLWFRVQVLLWAMLLTLALIGKEFYDATHVPHFYGFKDTFLFSPL